MVEPDREPEQLEGDGPAVLPEHEAMSLLSQATEPADEDEDAEPAEP